MSRGVMLLQHAAPENPGAIGMALDSRKIEKRIIRVDQGQAVPRALEGASGLVVMGGPMGVRDADKLPHLKDEMRLIEVALKGGVPILGVCLGSQLLAATLGARVHAAATKEIGWFEVMLRPGAQQDPLWSGLEETFLALHWHGDVFDLPADATALASSAVTEQQAFRHGAATYGILFHLEVTHAIVEGMVSLFADDLAASGVLPAAILASTRAHLARAADLAGHVFGRWADLVAARAADGA